MVALRIDHSVLSPVAEHRYTYDDHDDGEQEEKLLSVDGHSGFRTYQRASHSACCEYEPARPVHSLGTRMMNKGHR